MSVMGLERLMIWWKVLFLSKQLSRDSSGSELPGKLL